MKLEKGYVQIYTGNGKGKTTAALGQALRAVGRGLKVYMVQFLKTDETGELESVKKLAPDFQIFRFEQKRNFFWLLSEEEKVELQKDVNKAMEFVAQVIKSADCDILILDEIMGAMTDQLVAPEQLISLLKERPAEMEVILTGRDVPPAVAALADLITEMREVKHYYTTGVSSRIGIES